MKVLLCAECVDIRAMHPEGRPTTCRCGNVTAWWTDPHAGRAKVFARNRDTAFMIGLHNGFLRAAVSGRMGMWEDWRALHEQVCSSATGYVFHSDKRNCWAAPFQPTETSDVEWATEGDVQEQRETYMIGGP